ncbi:MAG: signal recognition particle-docking protein FtsY [Rickettsiales bacterium]|nr:signal recognition particle-docking protein FtsY [Rickettsiales bacterium]|tara:strand:- start:2261 stop:3418 length:1158 start_codon:yes stop_codon:yes gene_type:complete
MNELFASPLVLTGVALLLVVAVGLLLRLLSHRHRLEGLEDQLGEPRELDSGLDESGVESEADGLVQRMSKGLSATRERLVLRMDELFRGRRTIDEALWSNLEELLVTSDVGIGTATRLLEKLRLEADRAQLEDSTALRKLLQDEVRALLSARAGMLAMEAPGKGPTVIVVVGVNGAGKTTTIGKLAARHVAQGKKVVIGAGDTFRAAAIDQLEVWSRRAGAEVVRHEEGSDPAAVTFDAVKAGVARGADLVICDTAGRLHTKGDLMDELQKIHRVAGKALAGAPHEVLLVLDSTTGQNAVMQARQFSAAVGVTGIALTKLDGTARGGVILSIADEFEIPVKLIGIGEGVEDLRDFAPEIFVESLFGSPDADLGRGLNSAAAAAGD